MVSIDELRSKESRSHKECLEMFNRKIIAKVIQHPRDTLGSHSLKVTHSLPEA
jgi:hypothetical protein